MTSLDQLKLLVARAALPCAIAAALSVVLITVSGGVSFRVGSASIRAHSAAPSAIAAVVFGLLTFCAGLGGAAAASAWLWSAIERRALHFAIVIAIAAGAVGWGWGTHAAGGSDSYCYLNQAELLARGEVHDAESFVNGARWPQPEWTVVPPGHMPVPGPPGRFAPICPAGYPIMMVAARAVAGRSGMFAVVPLMAALAVWLTFLLGRRVGGPAAGLLASLLLAVSPIFLYQAVQPMNDVPAMTLWLAALVLASRTLESRAAAAACGLAVGAALMVRPNLLPLAPAVALTMLVARGGGMHPIGRHVNALAWFALGTLPGVLAVMAMQAAVYGSPLRSGYGDLGMLFKLSHVMPNLERYPRWLLETHTPVVLLALGAPLVLRRRGASMLSAALLAFSAVTFGCYLLYMVFDAWWFLRFLLPAIPPLLILASAVAVDALSRLAVAWRGVLFTSAAGLLAVACLHIGVDRDAFRLREYESVFRDGGQYVARRLPADAAVITLRQTGSVRFYAGRPTLAWDSLDGMWLDEAIEHLRRRGYHPFLLIERLEEPAFRKKYEPHSRFGGLAWPPAAEINREIRIYDPDSYAPYMRGEFVPTDRVSTRRQ
jgi:hypothetical protein